MTRLLLAFFVFAAIAARAPAQDDDSFFADYGAYSAYVDKMITTRQFRPFIEKMGGRDEYKPEELAKIDSQLQRLFPGNFTARTVFRELDLGGGIRQEARAFWGAGRYLFFYAILHQRDDALVVLNFSLNTKIEQVMGQF